MENSHFFKKSGGWYKLQPSSKRAISAQQLETEKNIEGKNENVQAQLNSKTPSPSHPENPGTNTIYFGKEVQQTEWHQTFISFQWLQEINWSVYKNKSEKSGGSQTLQLCQDLETETAVVMSSC